MSSWAEGIRFVGQNSEFLRDLRARVKSEFDRRGVRSDGGAALKVKALFLFGWFGFSYLTFLLVDHAIIQVAASVSCGIALAGVAFNVQHDGGHGAFGRSPSENQFAAAILDLLGMSSYLWRWKHNVVHHSYPNVDGIDDDVDGLPVARFHPAQPRLAIHRWQHIYLWLLYPLLTIRWALISDFLDLWRGRIGSLTYPPLARRDWIAFGVGKGAFASWAILIPVCVHGVETGVLFFAGFELVGGFLAAVAFQLAHCVADAEHASSGTLRNLGRVDWAAHQLRATVDFAPRSRVLNAYLGGLNLQAVHHLFPGVSHVHYPWIARILSETAADHGVDYRCNATLGQQIRSHQRWLRAMAQPPEVGASYKNTV